MNKFFKILCIPIGILILFAAGTCLSLFVIGEPVDGDTVVCDVTADDHQVHIHVISPDSAIAFWDNARLHQEGTELHITLRKVLASPLNSDGEWCMYLEIMDLTEIYLGGRLIWSVEDNFRESP